MGKAMSLDKGIRSGKEHRAPYYRSGKFDLTCRPHGGCPWCLSNRSHSHLKRQAAAAEQERDHGELEQWEKATATGQSGHGPGTGEGQ